MREDLLSDTHRNVAAYLFINSVLQSPQIFVGVAYCRAGYRIAEPEEELGSLLDVAKHQGRLHYHVWEMMLDTFEYGEFMKKGICNTILV